jgi:hypothetical protein
MAKKRRPRASGQFRIAIEGDSPPRIMPELTEREFAAIGFVTAQWSILEHALLAATIAIAEGIKSEPPRDAFNLSFTKRLRAWRNLIEDTQPEGATRKRLIRLTSRIANAETRRHQVAHGVWEWDIQNPDRLVVSSSLKPHIFERPTDFEKLAAFAIQIGKINYELMYGQDSPWKVVADDHAESGSSYSRSFLQSVMLPDPSNLDPPLATPQARKRPRPSSKG